MRGSLVVLQTRFKSVVLPALARPMTRIRKWLYFRRTLKALRSAMLIVDVKGQLSMHLSIDKLQMRYATSNNLAWSLINLINFFDIAHCSTKYYFKWFMSNVAFYLAKRVTVDFSRTLDDGGGTHARLPWLFRSLFSAFKSSNCSIVFLRRWKTTILLYSLFLPGCIELPCLVIY